MRNYIVTPPRSPRGSSSVDSEDNNIPSSSYESQSNSTISISSKSQIDLKSPLDEIFATSIQTVEASTITSPPFIKPPLIEDKQNEGENDLSFELRKNKMRGVSQSHESLSSILKPPRPKIADSNENNFVYQKGGILGIGGFGKVFLGLRDNGELIAVKELELSIDESDHKALQMVKAVEHEILLMKRLNHQHIVRYLGTQREKNLISIFLEYVPGGSIHELLKKFGSFPESVTKNYSRQILLGLEYLHSNQVIHRDIKGANILVDTKGNVKLADFGCSKLFSDLKNQASGFNSFLGTPNWMPPVFFIFYFYLFLLFIYFYYLFIFIFIYFYLFLFY